MLSGVPALSGKKKNGVLPSYSFDTRGACIINHAGRPGSGLAPTGQKIRQVLCEISLKKGRKRRDCERAGAPASGGVSSEAGGRSERKQRGARVLNRL